MVSWRTASASVCAVAPHLVYAFHLTIPAPTSLFLRLSLSSLRENGKQSEANCRAAPARHTQVQEEVSHAVTGRSLAGNEQPLADGCGAEMMHNDSTVSVSVA